MSGNLHLEVSDSIRVIEPKRLGFGLIEKFGSKAATHVGARTLCWTLPLFQAKTTKSLKFALGIGTDQPFGVLLFCHKYSAARALN